ncbi:MAG TPA: glycosyltransferase family 2 protein [Acidimicrobiales bacterium]|nr:glycosyltransferase family 2 protein [Acidimicrobiales bacterium]
MEAERMPTAGRSTPDVSVVAPAHNEEAYLAASVELVVAGLRDRGLRFEVVICENGSTDRTVAVAAELAARLPEVRYVTLPEADYGRALRAGFLAAAGRLVVNFDVDFVDLGFLDRALALEEAGADVVIGSKRTAGADDERPLPRRLVTGVFSVMLRWGFGLRASDTHGIKLLRKGTLETLVSSIESGRDIFDTELILRAERAGRQVDEVPVHVAEQRPPRTGIVGRIPRTLVGLARLRWRLWMQPVEGPGGSRRRRRLPRSTPRR